MPSKGTLLLHSIIALILSAVGVYVLLEKKIIVAGKLSGHLYHLVSPAHVVVAAAFFVLALFFLLALIQAPWVKKLGPWLFGGSLVLLSVGLFL